MNKRVSTGSTPLSRIRSARTLLDTFLEGETGREFAVFWKADSPPERYTVERMRRRVVRCASLLEQADVGPGDRVALILPQGADLVTAFLAALALGAAPAILAYPNFKFDPGKYRYGLQGVFAHLNARLAIIDSRFPQELREHLDPGRPVLELSEQRLEAAGEVPPLNPNVQPSDLAFVQHSAGTTGLQKAVALTHELVLKQLDSLVRALALKESDRVASWLPLYHDMGLVAAFILPLVAGIPFVLQSPLDWVLRPESFLELVTREQATLGWLPNFAFQFLARRVGPEILETLDLSSLRALISCSEPVLAESLDEFLERFAACGVTPDSLQSSYAMAENVFAVTQSVLVAPPLRLRVDRRKLLEEGQVEVTVEGSLRLVSSGRPLPGTAIRIVNSQGEVLLPGQVGEIQVRSRSLFPGYAGRPETRETCFQESWFRTRDRGFLYQGELFVLGREDDVIIVAGRNIFPEDVEAVAGRHEAVQDGRVVAFGVENPALGTRDLYLVAELKKGLENVDSGRISAEIRKAIRMEFDISPRKVKLVQGPWIIKSTAGKPARSATRKKFLEAILETPQEES